MAIANDNTLGTYLKDRRTKLDPPSFGLSLTRRRTPGLRREDVANARTSAQHPLTPHESAHWCRSNPRPVESLRPKPTRAQLLAATRQTIPDVIAPNLRVLFCGINPGLYSAATGHHFARPGNRFWPALHGAGFTERQLTPWEDQELLSRGCGITNLVSRTTANAAELQAHELIDGRRQLLSKVTRYAPHFVAVLGITAYRSAFELPKATLGLQDAYLGDARLWVLPNPSGLNAHHQLKDLMRLFAVLRDATFQ